VKKKSPPYAIIGAALLGLIAIIAIFEWKKGQDAQHAADLAAQQKALQDQIDQLKANNNPAPVVPTAVNMRNVYYATQPIEAGARISSAFFEKKLTPNEILPDAYPADSMDIVGFFAVRNIEKGDPLTPHNVGKTLPTMASRLHPGMRALALPIFNADANDTGGFVVDGDKVDLLYTLSANGFITSTQMVMQNVDVLFVPGPKMDSEQVQGVVPAPSPGDPIAITFQVTPEQAQALITLSEGKDGKFSMILRSSRDKSQIKIKPFVTADYDGNLKKVQIMTDKSSARVQELAAQIEAAEKTQAAQGTTNETTHPTPPSP
jgi:Flp pilus assembly protein CpaB